MNARTAQKPETYNEQKQRWILVVAFRRPIYLLANKRWKGLETEGSGKFAKISMEHVPFAKMIISFSHACIIFWENQKY